MIRVVEKRGESVFLIEAAGGVVAGDDLDRVDADFVGHTGDTAEGVEQQVGAEAGALGRCGNGEAPQVGDGDGVTGETPPRFGGELVEGDAAGGEGVVAVDDGGLIVRDRDVVLAESGPFVLAGEAVKVDVEGFNAAVEGGTIVVGGEAGDAEGGAG